MSTASSVKFTPDDSKIYVGFDYPTTAIDLIIVRLSSLDGSFDTSLIHSTMQGSVPSDGIYVVSANQVLFSFKKSSFIPSFSYIDFSTRAAISF